MFVVLSLLLSSLAGPDQRLGNGISRCRRLLPRVQRHGVGSQRGKRPSLNATAGTDHAEEHSWHQEFARDPQRPRKHF